MANLKCKTRGGSPQGKPRVYFCCHPADLDQYFEAVSNEILAQQNCAIWYAEEGILRDESFFEDLKQMQLFVMPVTTNLLCTENEALKLEFRFAMENRIPVLPLMQERGLETLFNEKCGDLQLLDKSNADVSAISYDKKLKKYLESVLIGDALAEKIRGAFDAYVFLSYRKKDRRYAQELMRLIHKNEFCRDIAIWYDEFLTPGENFNDSIKDAIRKSGLFVLAVTPNLVNETNYVMTTEYPMAKEEGKPILPAELVPTSRDQLSEKYEGLPSPADAHNEAEFSEALLESIKKMAIKENDSSPEHTFFIGLAYLGGVDVEVDGEKAVSLITSAAEAGLEEAMKKLADMYLAGDSVEMDPDASISWHGRIINQKIETYHKTQSEADFTRLLYAYENLGETYEQLRRNKDASDTYRRCADLCKAYTEGTEENLQLVGMQCRILNRLGYTLKLLGDHTNAFKAYNNAYEIALSLHSKTQNDQDTLCLVRSQVGLGELLEAQYNTDNAAQVYQSALDFLKKVKDSSAMGYLRIASDLYMKLGDVSHKIKSYPRALEYFKNALTLHSQLASESGSTTDKLNVAILHNKLGHTLLAMDEECDATDEYLISYEIVTTLHSQSPTVDVERQLMIISSHLAEINVKRESYELAEELYQDALGIAKKLADQYGTVEYLTDFRVACDKLASFYEKKKAFEKVMTLRFSELETAKKIADLTNTHRDLINLTISYNNLGGLMEMLGNKEAALSQYLNAYNLRKVLAKDENPKFLEALRYSCRLVGETYVHLGKIDEAKIYYKEAVGVCKKLVSVEDSLENSDLLGSAYVDLASLESGEEQCELLKKAIAIYKKLWDAKPDEKRYQSDLLALEDALADLDKKNSKKSFLQRLFGKK